MGKKGKAKGLGNNAKKADTEGFDDSGHGAAAGGDWGPIPEEKIDQFGASGWGESPIDETGHMPWRPDPNADHWEEAPAQNIRTLLLSNG